MSEYPHNKTNDGTVTDIGSGPITITWLQAYNYDSSERYVQIFNRPASEVTLGTTAADYTLVLPPNPGGNEIIKTRFQKACSYAVTTTPDGSTGPTTPARAVGSWG